MRLVCRGGYEVHFTRQLSNEIVTANKNSTCTTYQMLIWPVFAIDFVPRLLLPLARKKKTRLP
jgi:hypothetical protein